MSIHYLYIQLIRLSKGSPSKDFAPFCSPPLTSLALFEGIQATLEFKA